MLLSLRTLKYLELFESIRQVRNEKLFCYQSKTYLDFSIWIDNYSWSSCFWETDFCRYMILFWIPFVLKESCLFFVWIWLLSPLELSQFYMLWESMWLIGRFCICLYFCYWQYLTLSASQSVIISVSFMISEISFIISWCVEDRWQSQKYILSIPGNFNLSVRLSVFIISSIEISSYNCLFFKCLLYFQGGGVSWWCNG